MRGSTFNKVAGAALAAGLAIVGLHEISAQIFEPEVGRVACDFCPTPDPNPALDPEPDWTTVLATADPAQGAQVFDKCTSCHKPTDEDGTGPGLAGIVGRKPATHGGFAYSDPMKGHAHKVPAWTPQALYAYLKKPGAVVPGTKMTFVGLKAPEDRINLIAYLQTLK